MIKLNEVLPCNMGKLITNLTKATTIPQFQLMVSDELPKSSISPDHDLERLNTEKMNIDEKLWIRYRGLLNPLELLLGGRKGHRFGVSKFVPSNRAFFKLWEILVDFNFSILNSEEPLVSAHLAEGPGAFIEAVIHYRKHNPLDRQFGITLKDDSNPGVPDFSIEGYPNLDISYGSDGTGNLFNSENILAFQEHMESKAMFVTGDGGFETGYHTDKEQMNAKLLFAQIVSALHVQDDGGHFVLKAFQTETELTQDVLYILSFFYGSVFIHKPWSSRPANTERYFVCTGFKGIDNEMLTVLRSLLDKWESIEPGLSILNNQLRKYVHRLLNIKVPVQFTQKIMEYNQTHNQGQKQVTKILIENIRNRKRINTENQKENAIKWLNAYKLELK